MSWPGTCLLPILPTAVDWRAWQSPQQLATAQLWTRPLIMPSPACRSRPRKTIRKHQSQKTSWHTLNSAARFPLHCQCFYLSHPPSPFFHPFHLPAIICAELLLVFFQMQAGHCLSALGIGSHSQTSCIACQLGAARDAAGQASSALYLSAPAAGRFGKINAKVD